MRVISVWREKGRYFRLVKYPEKSWAELEVVHDGAWCFVEYAPDTVEAGAPQEKPVWEGKIYWQKDTTHQVKILEMATMRVAGPHDMCVAVVFQNILTGKVWVRPASEFFDGRFVEEEQKGKEP